jgi:hypothetical protein
MAKCDVCMKQDREIKYIKWKVVSVRKQQVGKVFWDVQAILDKFSMFRA